MLREVLLSLLGGFLVCRLLLTALERLAQRILCPAGGGRWGAVSLAAAMSFLHGAQDGQKFACLFFLAIRLSGHREPRGALILPLLALSAGSALVGGKILDALAGDAPLSRRGALAAEGSAALCLLACTLAGLPVSTTHTKSAALAAASPNGHPSPLSPKMLATWLLTFPACFLLSYLITKTLL